MDKLLNDLPPFTYNTIVKYVRNAGKNIQHSPASRRIFTSHSRNISRIEKCQKSETIGLMKDNFESSTLVFQHPMEGSDTRSFSHPALHDNHSCSTKARNNYPAWHYL